MFQIFEGAGYENNNVSYRFWYEGRICSSDERSSIIYNGF